MFRTRLLAMYFFAFLLGIALISFPGKARAESSPNGGQRSVKMDFDEADLKVFIKFISNLTGKNFVIEQEIKGKVTIISPTKITVDEAYKVFQSVLEVNGYTTVPSENVIKIVRAVEARQKNVETETGISYRPDSSDRFITRIIPLEFASCQKLNKILRPMVSKQGLLVAYEPTNTLILTDYQTNIRRLMRIIDEIDISTFTESIMVIPLKNASAEIVAKKLQELLSQGKKTSKLMQTETVSFVPDERTNSLVLMSGDNNLRKMEKIVKKLDTPTPEGVSDIKIRVIPLENAKAEEISKILSSLAGKKAKGKEEGMISSDVSVQPDKATNSLVILAEEEEIKRLKPIIADLDTPRQQVYVEAAILEVSTENSFNLGVDWQAGAEITSDGVSEGGLIGTSNGLVQTDVFGKGDTSSRLGKSGFNFGVLSFPFTFNDQQFFSLGAFIQASQTDNNVHIISTPQLMTMENQEAKVSVGENRPFLTSQQTNENDNDYNNYEYKDVGITLKVNPLINNKGWIKMDIFQEVSRIDPTSNLEATTPVTRKRTAETTVRVKDGQTTVIAGLMENKTTNSQRKVPGFGDIPVLGYLFKTNSDTESKTNLLVFITPHVVGGSADAKELTYRKSRAINEIRFNTEGGIKPLAKGFLRYRELEDKNQDRKLN